MVGCVKSSDPRARLSGYAIKANRMRAAAPSELKRPEWDLPAIP